MDLFETGGGFLTVGGVLLGTGLRLCFIAGPGGGGGVIVGGRSGDGDSVRE